MNIAAAIHQSEATTRRTAPFGPQDARIAQSLTPWPPKLSYCPSKGPRHSVGAPRPSCWRGCIAGALRQ